MDHGEKVKELEARERNLMCQTVDGARTGAVSDALRGELTEVRAVLKAARRVATMDAKRTEPKLTRQIGVAMTEDEYQTAQTKAAAAGVCLSKYIRSLLKP